MHSGCTHFSHPPVTVSEINLRVLTIAEEHFAVCIVGLLADAEQFSSLGDTALAAAVLVALIAAVVGVLHPLESFFDLLVILVRYDVLPFLGSVGVSIKVR